MPTNPTCTLSTGALKLQDGFVYAAHDAIHSLGLVSPMGVNETYTQRDGNFKTINGLDYIPITTILPPSHPTYDSVPYPDINPDDGGYHSANAATIASGLRRSKRNKRRPAKLRSSSLSPIPPSRTSPGNNHQHCALNTKEIILYSSPKQPPNAFNPSLMPPSTILSKHQTSLSNYSSILSPKDERNHEILPSEPLHPNHIETIVTHLKFGCRNMKNIIHMSQHNAISKLPSNLQRLTHSCPICMKCKLTKLPRNPPMPVALLKPGQMLQLDFAFINTESIRGFSSYLSCDCVKTKYSFRFCTRNKRAPVDIIRWIILTLKNQNKNVQYIRFDEGGELARSYEVNKMLVEEFNIIMQTTGGYASHLIGCTERGHRTDGDSIRTSLYAANLPDKFWCFALIHSNFINRRWCRYPDKITPYEKWTNNKPSFSKFHTFGSTIYVHNPQTKKLDHKSTSGIFLGYGASTSVLYYLDQQTQTIKRAHHAKIDQLQIGGNDDTPGSKLIRNHAQLHNLLLPPNSLTVCAVKTPFTYDKLFSYEIDLPPSGPLGINMENDKIFGLPIINSMESNSTFKIGCKKILQKNSWVVGIHHDEPVTVTRFLDYVEYLRSQKIFKVQITLTKRINPAATNYQTYRSYFDNFRPVSAKATIIIPEAKYAFQAPCKPPTPKSWGDVINSEFKDVWYKAVYERYDKNNNVGLLSIPVPSHTIPSTTTVLRAVSAFKIKNTSDPNIFDFYFRMCADGSKQIKGIDYDECHSPTPAIWSILTCVCVAAACDLVAYTIDIDNAFQNTPRYPTKDVKPIFITCPPLYMYWFLNRFPHYKTQYDPKEKYVLQCFMNMQGLRTAGRDFHQLLRAVLAELNISPTSVDNGIYVFLYKNTLVMLAISTDDILVFTKFEEFFITIKTKLHQAFGVTSQNDSVIYYLNYKIIQSEHAISVDQTDFIQEIVAKYIPKNSVTPKINTPLRTDRQFADEIKSSLPANAHELKLLSREYGADFRTIFGQLCHIMKASRPDLSNAINRLGVFQAAPNKLAFQSVFRVLQYLKTHPNVPLVYPKRSFDQHTRLTIHSSTGKETDSLNIPHCLCGHVDISFAPNKEFRHSIGGHVETLNAVAVDWRTVKQSSCATSATDSETRQYYTSAKRIIRIRQFLRQIGVTLPSASPILPSFRLNYELPTPIFEDNKGTRDMLAAGRVTSNLKHIDIPLTYLHSLHESGTITTSRANSHTMVANFMTKQETGPQHLKSTKWITGRENYPPINSDHFKAMTTNTHLSLL